jgi:hypothetical protein
VRQCSLYRLLNVDETRPQPGDADGLRSDLTPEQRAKALAIGRLDYRSSGAKRDRAAAEPWAAEKKAAG